MALTTQGAEKRNNGSGGGRSETRRWPRSANVKPFTSAQSTHSINKADDNRSGLALHPFVAAAVVLAVAMGVGRFAYTPLLVVMRGDAGLTVGFAGILASANLAGYLAGALLAMHPLARANRTALVRVGAILVVLTTAMMALPPAAWFATRCATGVASGLVFVLTASLLLDLVADIDSRHGLAIMFSGVGIGIATAGLLVIPFASLGGSRAAWLGLAAVSAVALAFALPLLPASCKASEANYETQIDGNAAIFGWLAVLYGVEGAAYIVPATFLVAMVSETPSIARYGTATWVLVGAVTAPSTIWWSAAARRWGLPRALLAACVAQALAMLAPFVLQGAGGAVALAVGLGATFIGISSLGTALGRALRPANGNATIGLLTVLYGVGQIIGPLVATRVALATGSYRFALLIVAGGLGLAAAAFALRLVTESLNSRRAGDGGNGISRL